MRRNILSIVFALCASICLSGCADTRTKEESLVFGDPNAEKEVEYLQEKLKVNQSDIESRMKLGRVFLSEDMFDEAIGEFEKVLSSDSNHIQASLLLALAFQKHPNPNLTEAAKLLERACELAPDNADVHLNLAQIYDRQKEHEKAIAEFDKAIELSDDPVTLISAHLGLMAIYEKQGESEKADEQYDAAYEIYPGVEEMIEQAEIQSITPSPKYVGEEFRDDEGVHPPLEKRIKRAREEMKKSLDKKGEFH